METTFTGALTCSDCGRDTNSLINNVCQRCHFAPHVVRGSWICGRCGVSNAPHVDRCGCAPSSDAIQSIGTDFGLSSDVIQLDAPLASFVPPVLWYSTSPPVTLRESESNGTDFGDCLHPNEGHF